MLVTLSELRGLLDTMQGDSFVLLPGRLALQGAPLVVPAGSKVTIFGSEQGPVTIDGQGQSRLFDVHGTLELGGMHLTGGMAEKGGAVYASKGSQVILGRWREHHLHHLSFPRQARFRQRRPTSGLHRLTR